MRDFSPSSWGSENSENFPEHRVSRRVHVLITLNWDFWAVSPCGGVCVCAVYSHVPAPGRELGTPSALSKFSDCMSE